MRRQFNRLYEKYGPEKAAALGGEFIEIMDKKRQEVRVAAIALLKELGEELECPSNPQPKGLRENPDLDEVFGA